MSCKELRTGVVWLGVECVAVDHTFSGGGGITKIRKLHVFNHLSQL
jgi:hypothetical protein